MTGQLKRAYDAAPFDVLRPLDEGKIIRLVLVEPPAGALKYGEYQLRSVGGDQIAVCGREINADVWYVMEGPWCGLLK